MAPPSAIPAAPADVLGNPTLRRPVFSPADQLGEMAEALLADSVPRKPRFDRAVAIVLQHEGGLTDHPDDSGGITNFGISLRAAMRMGSLADGDGDGDVDAEDIRSLTVEQARAIYRALYWNVVRGDELPEGVDLAVFDWAVNAGPLRAARGLQRAVGVAVDGAVGPVTLRAVAAADPVVVVRKVCRLRLEHLRGLKTWGVFGRGWGRRVAEVQEAAERWIRTRAR